MDNEQDQKAAEEVARADFERWAEAWGIDFAVDEMTDEDRQDFERLQGSLLRAIRDGSLVVSENGEKLEHTLRDGRTITYNEPRGAAWLAMDKHKQKESAHKLFRWIATITGQPVHTISDMRGADVKLATSIAQLLWASLYAVSAQRVDYKWPAPFPDQRSPHTRLMVYSTMYAQICRDYTSLPPFDEITAEQIRWFYDMLRPELHKATEPKPSKG